MSYKNTLIVFALVCGAALLLPEAASAQAPQANAPHPMAMNGPRDQRIQLHDAMRRLWEDHVTYTRLFIVSDVGNLPDKEATTKRLLKNQQDLGNAIKPYYGEQAGTQLAGLLIDHIVIASKLVDAAKAHEGVMVADLTNRWFANADNIATFLSKANPDSWPITATQQMMHDHLDLTLQEATNQVQGKWADSMAAYDKIVDQAIMMADTLSSGIIKQFPDRFGERRAATESPAR